MTTPPDSPSALPTPGQRRLCWMALTGLAVALLAALVGLAFWAFIAFLSWFYPVLLPIGLAVIIALVLGTPVNFLQKHGWKRGSATAFVLVLAVIAVLGFWAFVLPQLIHESVDFAHRLPSLLDGGVAKAQQSLHRDGPAAAQGTSAQPGTADSMRTWLGSNLATLQQDLPKEVGHLAYSGLGTIGQAIGFLFGFGFVPIYVYYFLADQEYLGKHWQDFVPLPRGRVRTEIIGAVTEINDSLVAYLRGQIIVAAVNGVLTFVGLTVIQVPYALVLGVIAGGLSIVPFLGVISSLIPALLLALISANGDPTWQWLKPVLVLVVFAVVQMSESMFVTPRVQSHSTGLHPLVIILGIIVWSMLLPGLLGPVVAVPLTCAVIVLLRRYVWEKPKPPAAAR